MGSETKLSEQGDGRDQEAVSSAVPIFDVDPYADDFLTDPYADYEAFRDAGPVISFSRYGAYAVARHEEVQAVLTQPEIFRSEEHTSELQSLMRISYAVLCLTKKIPNQTRLTSAPLCT